MWVTSRSNPPQRKCTGLTFQAARFLAFLLIDLLVLD
jgi:hypothetical protein